MNQSHVIITAVMTAVSPFGCTGTAGRIMALIQIAVAFVRKQVAPNLPFSTITIEFKEQ